MFSVVIPTHNRLDYLKQTLESVWAQTCPGDEIIVIDDGSVDGTNEYLSSIKHRVKVVHQTINRGAAAARNLGAEHATSRYLVFLDSDDLWLPWTLDTYKSLVDTYAPSLISAAVLEFSNIIPTVCEKPLRAEFFQDYLETARDPGFIGTGALVIDREEFDLTGGFDESLVVAEDHDFLLQVGLLPGFIRVRSPVTLLYRRHCKGTADRHVEACAGALAILKKEADGNYPGGRARRLERLMLISRMVRPIALAASFARVGAQSWYLYQRSFLINVRLGRIKFLIGFVLMKLRAMWQVNNKSKF